MPGNMVHALATKRVAWKLKKSLYGLKQSQICFYNQLDRMLNTKGYVRIMVDYGVWMMNGVVSLIVHVDDMLVLGMKIEIGNLKFRPSATFEMQWIRPLDDTVYVGRQIQYR